MIVRSDHRDIHRRALMQDDGRYFILTLAALSSTISFGAIFAQLANIKDMPASGQGPAYRPGVATIVGSWFFVHMTFALHYAHEFFSLEQAGCGRQNGRLHRISRRFSPDYFRFLYFSYVIGVACATADVNITGTSVRRLALVHCILAFFTIMQCWPCRSTWRRFHRRLNSAAHRVANINIVAEMHGCHRAEAQPVI